MKKQKILSDELCKCGDLKTDRNMPFKPPGGHCGSEGQTDAPDGLCAPGHCGIREQ